MGISLEGLVFLDQKVTLVDKENKRVHLGYFKDIKCAADTAYAARINYH